MCRVLVLDDEKENGELVADYLQRSKEPTYQVTVFQDAEAALDAVRQKAALQTPFDVLLIDHRLGPGKDGIEVMQEMRRITPEADAIIFTGFEDVSDGYRAYEAGAYRYLLKPFKPKELLFLLRSLEQWRRERREHDRQKIHSQMVEDALQRNTFHEVARVVVAYAQRLGFERAHLFWSPRGEDKGKDCCLVGIISAGEGCPPEFEGHLFHKEDLQPFDQALQQHDARIFFIENANGQLGTFNNHGWMGLCGLRPPRGEWAILPLWSGDSQLGALVLDYNQNGKSIHEHERPWLNLFARQVSVVLERASLFEHERRSRDETEVISRIGQRITTRAALDELETLLEEVREQVKKLMDTDNFIVVLADEETHQLDFRLHYEAGQRVERHWLPIGEGLAAHLLRQREAVYIPSGVKEYREARGIPLYGQQAQCWLGVPLRVSDRVIGALIVQDYKQPDKFKRRDKELLEAIADQVAGAIQINRMAESEREDAERMRVLQRANAELLRIADESEDKFWFAVLTIATANFGMRFNRALLFLAEDNNRYLRGRLGIGSESSQEARRDWEADKKRGYNFEAFLGDLAQDHVKHTPFASTVQSVVIDLAEGESAFSEVARTGQRKIIFRDEAAVKLPASFNRQFSFGECAVLPLRAGNRTLGILLVDNKHDQKPLRGKMLDRLETLLNNVGLVWENQRQRRQREALLEVNHAIMSEAGRRPLAHTLQRICEAARQLSGADWAIIYPLRPGANAYEYDKSNISYAGDLKQPIQKVIKEKPRQRGVSTHILRSGRLVVPDIERDQTVIGRDRLQASHFIQREEVKALMGIPIRDPLTEESLGVLYLDYRTPHPFSEGDIRLAETFANLAAVAINNAHRFEQERQSTWLMQHRDYEISRRMLEQALASDTEDKVILALVSNIQIALGWSGPQISLILRRWQAASLDAEPEEVHIRYSVTDQNTLEQHQVLGTEDLLISKAIGEKSAVYNTIHSQVYIPVKMAESVIGVLFARAARGKLQPEAISILERFAPVVALALDNIRRQENLYAVLHAAQAVTAPTDLAATFRSVVETVRQVSPELSALTLWHRDIETGAVQLSGCFGVHNLPTMQDRVRDKQTYDNIVCDVMEAPGPIWASNLDEHPELVRRFVKEENIVSVAAFPLRADYENIGTMFFNYRKFHFFTAEERTIFTMLAEFVGASIRDALRLEIERKERARLNAAMAIAETVATELDLEQILVKVLERLGDLFDQPTMGVLLYNKEERRLEFSPQTMAFYKIDRPEHLSLRSVSVDGPSIASRVARQALTSGQMEIANIADVHANPDYLELISEIQSELCISLMGSQGLLGVLVLERPRLKGFDQDEVDLVKSAARQIGLAMERGHQTRQLSFKSTVAATTAWAADLAHDINRHVGQISGWAYLARECADQPDAVREYAKKIEENARYLSSAGPWQNPEPKRLALDDTIRRYLQDLARERSLRLELELGCKDIEIFANPVAFQRVLRQLTRNALQAIGQANEKRLTVRTQAMGGGLVEIQFQDNGPGVDEAIRAAIFQQPVSTRGDQRGFGLLLTRQMVEDMGGVIRLLPQQAGGGATFSVRLPVASPDAQPSPL